MKKRKLIKLCASWEHEYQDLLISINESDVPESEKKDSYCVAEILNTMTSELRAVIGRRKKKLYELYKSWDHEFNKYEHAAQYNKQAKDDVFLPCADWHGAANMYNSKIWELCQTAHFSDLIIIFRFYSNIYSSFAPEAIKTMKGIKTKRRKIKKLSKSWIIESHKKSDAARLEESEIEKKALSREGYLYHTLAHELDAAVRTKFSFRFLFDVFDAYKSYFKYEWLGGPK